MHSILLFTQIFATSSAFILLSRPQTALSSTQLHSNFRTNAFISPLQKERLQKGLLTPRELDKLFNPTKAECDTFLKISSSGFAGVIFSLDTALVDMKQLFGYSYALLSGEIQQPTPNPKIVYDCIGSPFKTCVTAFGWTLDTDNLESYELKFYEIFNKLLDLMPYDSYFGATKVIDDLIKNGDEITVITSLPRSLAIKILKKTQLSRVFEGRVPAEHLVCREDINDGQSQESYDSNKLYDEKYSGQRIIQCCGYMRSPTMLSVYVDGNRRNILSAKRDGLGVIAIQGYAQNPFELKAADRLISKVESITPTSIYKLVRERMSHAEGPGQQTATSRERLAGGGAGGRLLVASPVEDEPSRKTNHGYEETE